MSEKNEYHCNWCDRLTNTVVKVLKEERLVWVGCPDCLIKKKELENNVTE